MGKAGRKRKRDVSDPNPELKEETEEKEELNCQQGIPTLFLRVH